MPSDISARDLLKKWVLAVKKAFPSALVPIHWFVNSPGHGKLERMPFQFNHSALIDSEPEDFLSFYDEIAERSRKTIRALTPAAMADRIMCAVEFSRAKPDWHTSQMNREFSRHFRFEDP